MSVSRATTLLANLQLGDIGMEVDDFFAELDAQQSKILRMLILRNRLMGIVWAVAVVLSLALVPITIVFLMADGRSDQFLLLAVPVGVTALLMITSTRNTARQQHYERQYARVVTRQLRNISDPSIMP